MHDPVNDRFYLHPGDGIEATHLLCGDPHVASALFMVPLGAFLR